MDFFLWQMPDGKQYYVLQLYYYIGTAVSYLHTNQWCA